jgi:hypothetical protein
MMGCGAALQACGGVEVDERSSVMVTHRTPIRERWGGYYVTGDTGSQRHRAIRATFHRPSTSSSLR